MPTFSPLNFDKTKSLQELDGENWGGAAPDQTGLVQRCHCLRRVPLEHYGTADLRIMIGQSIGLEYLVPLALERLLLDPLVEGDCYAGDLLASLLRADSRYYIEHPNERQVAGELVKAAFAQLPALDPVDKEVAEAALSQANDIFKRAEYFAQQGRA